MRHAGGTGTGAKANVTVTNGVITSVFVTDRGTGYATNDSLSVALGGVLGNGTGAQINVGGGNASNGAASVYAAESPAGQGGRQTGG